MDPTHLHLLLNHVPTVGYGVGIALFVLGIGTRSNDLKQASLVVLVGVALISIPTYATGNAAQVHLQERGDVSDGSNEGRATLSLIETHEGAAFLALAFMEVTGALAWVALWKFRRRSRLSTGMTGALLLLSLVAMALMVRFRAPDSCAIRNAPRVSAARMPMMTMTISSSMRVKPRRSRR